MLKPYATAIIPTHNRASTLEIALRSIQSQTVQDIEILLVLDGANKACQQIAKIAAEQDERIRVLDLPKAPGSGEQNVHHAVTEARSERIFYNDDDDIWLPMHVETLGPCLDKNHIVDSRVATASREYDLHLTPCPASNSHIRQLLAKGIHKSLFDTHIAHTREGYEQFTRWVPRDGESSRPVWEFLKGFSENPTCQWTSLESVTAISLHGANRRDMTDPERTAEIENYWKSYVNPGVNGSLITAKTSDYHLFRLLDDIQHRTGSFEDFVRDYEVFDDCAQSETARILFNLIFHQTIERDQAVQITMILSKAIFVGYMSHTVNRYLEKALDLDELIEMFEYIVNIEGTHQTGAFYSLALFKRRKGDQSGYIQALEKAVHSGPDPILQLRSELENA